MVACRRAAETAAHAAHRICSREIPSALSDDSVPHVWVQRCQCNDEGGRGCIGYGGDCLKCLDSNGPCKRVFMRGEICWRDLGAGLEPWPWPCPLSAVRCSRQRVQSSAGECRRCSSRGQRAGREADAEAGLVDSAAPNKASPDSPH
jgi:hypothetical protein